jgi:hypothetical protein
MILFIGAGIDVRTKKNARKAQPCQFACFSSFVLPVESARTDWLLMTKSSPPSEFPTVA